MDMKSEYHCRGRVYVLLFALAIGSLVPCSSSGGGWGACVEDLDEFVEKYRKAKGLYDLKTSAASSIAMKIAAVEEKYSLESRAATLKIGEFESEEEFRARVERQKKADGQNGSAVLQQKNGERADLERERAQLLAEAEGYKRECNDCAFAFTNKIREAYALFCSENLPYFDRASMSFKDIPSPIYQPAYVSDHEKRDRTKFVVNAEVEDFDAATLPKDYSKYEGDETYGYGDSYCYSRPDSYTHWLTTKRRRLNVNSDEKVSLKFKDLKDARDFKEGLTNGTIKACIGCTFKVGLPSEWIVEQGHYEAETMKNSFIGILNAIKYRVNSDTTKTGKQIWHPAIIGRIVPVRIETKSLIVAGAPVKSMDIEIVSESGTWNVEKREGFK